MKQGILLIDKPANMTSHDVVSIARKKLKFKKIGHTGTLDPFATGLMILVIGSATKLSTYFTNFDKIYEGVIEFGYQTDTFDKTGEIVAVKKVEVEKHDVIETVAYFNGLEYEQTPPLYSAIKQGGKKLYELARAGQTTIIPSRVVQIIRFKMTDELNDNRFSFQAEVSKGTYLRSLAVDFGARLGTLATLAELRRVSSGQFHVSKAISLEEIAEDQIISLQELLKDANVLILNDYLIRLVKNGVELDHRQIETDQPFIVSDQNGNWIAYYIVKEKQVFKPLLFFEEIT